MQPVFLSPLSLARAAGTALVKSWWGRGAGEWAGAAGEAALSGMREEGQRTPMLAAFPSQLSPLPFLPHTRLSSPHTWAIVAAPASRPAGSGLCTQ